MSDRIETQTIPIWEKKAGTAPEREPVNIMTLLSEMLRKNGWTHDEAHREALYKITKKHATDDSSDSALLVAEEILSAREKFRDTPILSGRHIVALWSNEKEFLRPSFMRALEAAGASLTNASYNEKSSPIWNPKLQAEYKTRLRDTLMNSPPPMTLVYNGHSEWGKFYLIGWFHNSSLTLSWSELADMYRGRIQKFWKEAMEKAPDVFIFDCCYSMAFTDEFTAWLNHGDASLPHPVIIGSSQDNPAVTLVDENDVYGSDIFRNVIWMEKKREGYTIGEMIQNLTYKNPLKNPDPKIQQDLDSLYTPPYLMLPTPESTKASTQVASNHLDQAFQMV